MWSADDILLETKIKPHDNIPLNLLLCGGYNLSGNKEDIKIIKTFENKAIRRILEISMSKF